MPESLSAGKTACVPVPERVVNEFCRANGKAFACALGRIVSSRLGRQIATGRQVRPATLGGLRAGLVWLD
jgi:hypothetical protein